MSVMRFLWFMVSLKGLALVVLAFLGWQVFVFSRPRPPELTEQERHAVEQLCREFVERMAAKLAPAEDETPLRVGVAHLLSDPTDEVTTTLRRAVAGHPRFEVDDRSVIKRFLKDVTSQLEGATTLEQILNAGRRVDLDVVIAGSVRDITSTEADALATVQLRAFAPGQKRRLLNEAVTGSSTVAAAREDENHGGGSRILVWLLGIAGIAALPWITAPLSFHARRQRTNAAGALLLLGYTAIGMAALALLGLYTVTGPWLPAALAVSVAVLGTYNYCACETLAKRET